MCVFIEEEVRGFWLMLSKNVVRCWGVFEILKKKTEKGVHGVSGGWEER